jgi:hypothetical protein
MGHQTSTLRMILPSGEHIRQSCCGFLVQREGAEVAAPLRLTPLVPAFAISSGDEEAEMTA